MPNIKARITNKHDTEANWALAENFKPLAGEVIVYDIDSNYAYPRFKVGDGKTLVSALPFSTDVLASYVTETELASALNETTSAINKNIATIDDEVATHIAAINNPHQVTKSQVGLGKVDNTSDLNKPVSTAQQAAIDAAIANTGTITASGGFQAGNNASVTSGGAAVGASALATSGGAAVGRSASSTYGGAVGNNASTTHGGAIGRSASSTYGGAVGNSALSTFGGAVGQSASSNSGGAVGHDASSDSGGAIGYGASSTSGGAVGYGASSTIGFSGGYSAVSNVDAIQLGIGTNPSVKTLQIYDDNIYNATSHTLTVNNAQVSGQNVAVQTGTYNSMTVGTANKATYDSTGNNIANTYATSANLNSHINNKSNPHGVTKAQVGLGKVDNTSDLNKPVSTAQQAAIDAAIANTGTITASGGFQAGNNASVTSGGAAVGASALATSGGAAVGASASSDFGGGAVGNNASSNFGGFAGGNNASTDYGGAVGRNASSTAGGAVGENASATSGGAIGYGASSERGGAVGSGASSTGGFSGGSDAKSSVDAIQLGTGTNPSAKTLQIYTDNIYNATSHTLTVQNATVGGNTVATSADINKVWYGTCSTAASTYAKTATCSGFTLDTGATILVKMTYAHTSSTAATLNVNSTGAKTIKDKGNDNVTSRNHNSWQAGGYCVFIYDGTYWVYSNSDDTHSYLSGTTLYLYK